MALNLVRGHFAVPLMEDETLAASHEIAAKLVTMRVAEASRRLR